MDFTALIGIPYRLGASDVAGCDCWGLVELAFRELLGIELPPYNRALSGQRAVPQGTVAAHALREIGAGHWEPVDPADARLLDVVLLHNRRPCDHVGMVATPSRWMLTTARDTLGSRLEEWQGPRSPWAGRVAGVWRHARAG